jgi:hypothetical protein
VRNERAPSADAVVATRSAPPAPQQRARALNDDHLAMLTMWTGEEAAKPEPPHLLQWALGQALGSRRPLILGTSPPQGTSPVRHHPWTTPRSNGQPVNQPPRPSPSPTNGPPPPTHRVPRSMLGPQTCGAVAPLRTTSLESYAAPKRPCLSPHYCGQASAPWRPLLCF